MGAKEVKEAAQEAGIALRTLDRAKTTAGVVATSSGYQGTWSWSLPEDSAACAQARQTVA